MAGNRIEKCCLLYENNQTHMYNIKSATQMFLIIQQGIVLLPLMYRIKRKMKLFLGLIN
jgi:hypothetical protein